MQATRERKERFILSFGKSWTTGGNEGVGFILYRAGLSCFTDEAIDEMVDYLIELAQQRIKSNIRNRRVWAAFSDRASLASSAVDEVA